MSRRKAREYAFKVLFQVDQVTARPVDALNYLLQESDLAEKDVIFSRELIASAVKNQKEIDEIITAAAGKWQFRVFPPITRGTVIFTAPGCKSTGHLGYGYYNGTIIGFYGIAHYCIHINHFFNTLHGSIH
jgi:hypothetical protein